MNGNESEQDAKEKRPSRGISNDAKSRNWRFLFDNLKRAVGYIYSMCEQDGDIEECKEAIMVLHNRIKEFEGLIQYIEVQASYETSDERPSSVAWEVPVSAIKQPSLPFQPNGDPQLYYYPVLPQAYPQYSMPGTYPMMDPNLVNYLPYNQQYTGYPTDYMSQSGTSQPQPQQYQQYNNYPDFNNNISNSSSKTNKKSYSKSRRSKNDQYKANSSDNNHPSVPQVHNLNSLDVPVDDFDVTNIATTQDPVQTGDYANTYSKNVSSREDPNSVAADNDTPVPPEIIDLEHFDSNNVSPTIQIVCEEGTIHVDTCEELVKSDNSCESFAINEGIADAIDDRSSVEDESVSVKTKGNTADWTVVNTVPDTYVHVSENCSDHSLPTSPLSNEKVSENMTNNEIEAPVAIIDTDIIPLPPLSATEIEGEDATAADKNNDIVTDSDTAKELTHITMCDVTVGDVIEGASIEYDIDVPKIISNEVKTIDADLHSQSSESSKNVVGKKNNDILSGVDVNIKDSADCDTTEVKSSITLSKAKSCENDSGENVSNIIENELKPSKTDFIISAKDDCETSTTINESENHNNCSSNDTLAPKHIAKQKDDRSNVPAKELKLSCSSELSYADSKEVDLLSESGRSTVSSGSVQSCMSLPSNPLARSTSWAELVRKGKADSPVPGTIVKLASSAKYQSTPSRYLSHRQPNPKIGKPTIQPALSKSKSVPSQRLLTKAPFSKKTTSKPKETLLTEDGWCVSSGKSRFKVIAGVTVQCNDALIKTSEAAKSHVVTKLAVTPVSTSKTSTDNALPKSKASESSNKPKTPRSVKVKATPVKPTPAKVSSRASTIVVNSKTTPRTRAVSKTQSTVSNAVTKTNTGLKTNVTPRNNPAPKTTKTISAKVSSGISKNSVAKPLVKTRSLESPTKLLDKIKVNNSQMSKKAKSLDPLEKSEISEKVNTKINQAQPKELDNKIDDGQKDVNETTTEIIKEVADSQGSLQDENSIENSDQVKGESFNQVETVEFASEEKPNEGSGSEHKVEEHSVAPSTLVIPQHEEEDNQNTGKEENSYNTGREETSYNTGREENSYNTGREENSYNTGREENSYNTGREENSYNTGREENSYNTGREENSYNTGREEENYNVGRAMMSKRNRQLSEPSSVSTDTQEEDEVRCLSPGRSSGRSPSSRSPGGRSPGKAPQLHQRLSSPSRRRNTTDNVLKNHQERLIDTNNHPVARQHQSDYTTASSSQSYYTTDPSSHLIGRAKAQVIRDKIQEEKANKLKKIKIKEGQIKDLQEQQEKDRVARSITHAEKLARAETLRDMKIAEVKRKAQEEEQKVNEIAFINSLEASNRKMELLSKEHVAEAKRVEIQVRQQEERKRRSEELQAKEDAVLERKLVIEADRLARIAHIEDKIKESQAKVNFNKLEMETAAKDAAKDRALEREITREIVRHDRNPVIESKPKHKGRQQQQANSKLREMQQKAAMLCQKCEYLPSHSLYEPAKWCSKCNIKIVSEAVLMAHMIKQHQKSSQDEAEVESQYIVDYSDELCPIAQDVVDRQKMLRKRSKKVRTRIVNKISELPAAKLLEPPQECPNKNRLFKCIKAMKNQKTNEKGLVDLSRTVLTKTDVDHLIDKGVVDQLCEMIAVRQLLGPLSKVLIQCSTLSTTGCQLCIRSLPEIIDCLQPSSGLLSPAMQADLLKLTATLTRSLTPCDSLTSDVVSYIVSKEIIDNIQTICANTYQLKDESECAVVINSLELLSSCCVSMTTPNLPVSCAPTKNDPSQLVDTLVVTKACSIVSLLYGVLLYEGPRRIAPALSRITQSVVKQCLSTFLHIARFSLHTLQSVLDREGMSLALRHVVSYILSSASHHGYTEILDLCIQLTGLVVFSHPSNQKMLQNGPSPSILQLLSSLPFSYFSDMRAMGLLFPTLISACHNCPSNLAILQEKVNKVMLVSFLKDQLKESKGKHINLYPRTAFQQALKFLDTPAVEVT